MTNVGFVGISLIVYCPACDTKFDEVDQDNSEAAGLICTNEWDKIKELDITCPHCFFEFKLDDVQY